MIDPIIDRSSFQILIVDDSPDNLKLLSNLLTEQGYKVRPAPNGELALRSTAVEKPDLIMLDVRMPGMDGYEVCRALKANREHRDIPVIFISALDETADKVRGFNAGGVDYIAKPFEPAEVLARVKTHIRLHTLQQRMEDLVAQRTRQLSRTNEELTIEIAERNKAEQALIRLNRTLRMYSACNQVLVHAVDEESFLNDICHAVINNSEYLTACAGYVVPGTVDQIRIAASAGCTFSCLLKGEAVSEADTPLRRAVRTGQMVIVDDVQGDERFNTWCPQAEQSGLLSAIAIPLKNEGVVFGVICIISRKENTFHQEEQSILAELADDMTYGITTIRNNKALREKEARMESIGRASPTGIAVISNRAFLEVNNRLCEMLGYTESELVGKTTRCLYRTEQLFKNAGDHIFNEVACKGTSSLEVELLRKDGTCFDALLNSALILDTSGNRSPAKNDAEKKQRLYPEYHVTYLDISERKQMEKKLRESEIRYRTIFDNTGTAMVIIEEDDTISLVNQEFAKLTGYDRAEMEGMIKWSFFFPPQQPATSESGIGQVDGKTTDMENRCEADLRTRSGHVIRVFISMAVIQDTGRQVASIIDITEQKKLEIRMLQAQKMEAIGNLAGGIAHDFNNILSAMIGYTGMAIASCDPQSKMRRYLDQVYQAGERAGELVKQILTFSRQNEQILQPLSITIVAKELLKLLRSSLPTTIELKRDFRILPQEDIVQADATQMHQVLLNLCTNAAQAMQPKGGVLTLKIEELRVDSSLVRQIPDLNPGPYVKISVSDTGKGIDPTIMERIFEPYFTTKEVGEGTGMGLAVVMGIVKKHDGAITVYSQPGKGSVFRVYLPKSPMAAVRKKEKSEQHAPHGQEHILFVDDEQILVNLGSEMLEELGYQVTAVTDSRQAFERFKDSPDEFDLIFTDMTMPDMTGAELAVSCMEIREDIPVIITSGYSELIDEGSARDIGIKGFMHKPYAQFELAKQIREILDKAKK